ncbi:MAG: hypothetical protein P4L51_18790 [Puia sp.]|nr:hypothetical protein [Puia sp.]
MRKYWLFLIIWGLLAANCHKKEAQGGVNCDALACPLEAVLLKFRVIDKQTGQDYFFSNPPKYPISALQIKPLEGTADTLFYTDSSLRFFSILFPVAGNYTYQILVQGLEPDTVQCVVGLIPTGGTANNGRACCLPPFEIQQLLLNGEPVSGYSDTTVLEIAK